MCTKKILKYPQLSKIEAEKIKFLINLGLVKASRQNSITRKKIIDNSLNINKYTNTKIDYIKYLTNNPVRLMPFKLLKNGIESNYTRKQAKPDYSIVDNMQLGENTIHFTYGLPYIEDRYLKYGNHPHQKVLVILKKSKVCNRDDHKVYIADTGFILKTHPAFKEVIKYLTKNKKPFATSYIFLVLKSQPKLFNKLKKSLFEYQNSFVSNINNIDKRVNLLINNTLYNNRFKYKSLYFNEGNVTTKINHNQISAVICDKQKAQQLKKILPGSIKVIIAPSVKNLQTYSELADKSKYIHWNLLEGFLDYCNIGTLNKRALINAIRQKIED